MNKKMNLFYSLCIIVPCIIFGLWMMSNSEAPKHGEIEKAPVYFVKEIWGPPAGLTILSFGILWLILSIIRYKKVERAKPNNMLYTFYFAWMFIFTVSGLLYGIVLLQNFLGATGVLPVKYVFENMADLHLVFIMFIFIFGILTLVFKWRSNVKEKKA